MVTVHIIWGLPPQGIQWRAKGIQTIKGRTIKEELRATQSKLAWLLFFVFESSRRPKQRSKRKSQKNSFLCYREK